MNARTMRTKTAKLNVACKFASYVIARILASFPIFFRSFQSSGLFSAFPSHFKEKMRPYLEPNLNKNVPALRCTFQEERLLSKCSPILL